MHRRHLLIGMGGAAALSLAPPAFAQKPGRWLRLESPNFILFSAMDEKAARAELVALERFHNLLIKFMPREKRSAMKLQIYIADTDTDFLHAWPGADKHVGGFYSSRIEHVRAVTAPGRAVEKQGSMQRNIRALDARTILFHEYTHHFVRANNRMIYPRWYQEGFAEFLSTAEVTDSGINLGMFTRNRALWLNQGDWMNIETFLAGTKEFSDKEMAMFYAQAWLAAHYMFMTPERSAGFDKYCVALQGGADPIAAFEPAFGITPQTFNTELKAYKRKPMQFFRVPDDGAQVDASIQVTRLNPAADNLLLAHSYARSIPKKEDMTGTLTHIKSEVRKNPADPFAMRAAALAEVWYGDLAEARKLLDALLLVEPDEPETRYLSGLCDLRTAYRTSDPALARKARGAFTAAHRIDGTRASSLFRYVECDYMVEKAFNAHLTEVLLAAYQLAPQIDVLALVTAQALLQFEKWNDVRYVLRPLASSAHEGGVAKVAQVYLQAADTQTKPPITFFGAADTLEYGVFE